MCDKALTIAWEHIDNRNLNHCVATRLLLERSTCYVDEYLCSKSRVVNLHVELEELVVCLTRNTLTSEVYAMTNIIECVNALYLEYVCLITCEVWVSLDSLCNLSKVSTFLKLYIYHTAVDTLTYRDSH